MTIRNFDRKMRNNSFNGTLNMGDSIGQQLQLVDFENNKISSVTLGSKYTNTLMLVYMLCQTSVATPMSIIAFFLK